MAHALAVVLLAGTRPAGERPDNGLLSGTSRCLASTWERACSRVRLGHVIRYIGRGRAAAQVRAPRKPDVIHSQVADHGQQSLLELPVGGERAGPRPPSAAIRAAQCLVAARRPAAAQPDLDAEPFGHGYGIGDQPELALRAFGIHARDGTWTASTAAQVRTDEIFKRNRGSWPVFLLPVGDEDLVGAFSLLGGLPFLGRGSACCCRPPRAWCGCRARVVLRL